MRRQVIWSDEAKEQLRICLDPLPGRHHPKDPDRLFEDVAFIVEVLAEGFDELPEVFLDRRRFTYHEPQAADLISVFAELVSTEVVEVVVFDAWPPGQSPPYELEDWE